MASVSGGQMNIDHLHGLELVQRGTRRQTRSCVLELMFERNPQTISQEGGIRPDRVDVFWTS